MKDDKNKFLKPGMVKLRASGAWCFTVVHFELGEIEARMDFSRPHDAKRTMRFWVEIANGSGLLDMFRYWWKRCPIMDSEIAIIADLKAGKISGWDALDRLAAIGYNKEKANEVLEAVDLRG